MCPSLFHLHFNTPNVSEAATRLCEARLTLQRRFGSVRGEGTPLTPEEDTPDDFRLKLQVHQHGAVNITLAPGQRPHFDHLGLAVSNLEDTIDRVKDHGWSVRPNDAHS
ncbi:VOC family protein [Halocatena marina]|uniref:VOC family protein n=1 Tax=Halocatena marina TaxID=2934937 RepID=UPI00200E34C7|nr:VOC family protein [Halocatena marina]